MDLTTSFLTAVPKDVLARYEFIETRNAASLLAATNPEAWEQLLEALRWFQLRGDDLVYAGGQESELAARLNGRFRADGWREAKARTDVEVTVTKLPYRPHGELYPLVATTKQSNESYLIDNVVDRVALDVEWNAKDGNLDRDLAAYRALYEGAMIDGAVMITRTLAVRDLARQLALDAGFPEAQARKRLGTTTTTNDDKLRPRMLRGDAGGCPLLGVLICDATWDGEPATPLDGHAPSEPELEAEKDPLLDADVLFDPDTDADKG